MSLQCLAPMFAGSSSYHPSGTLGGHCADSLSKPEIAALMAGLKEFQINFVYAYFGDERAENRLIAHVRSWLCDLSMRERWSELDKQSGDGVGGRPVVSNIGALAVFEVVRPNVCPMCHGSGLLGDWLNHTACRRCSGTGHVRLANRKVAGILGVPETSYRRKWCARYESAFRYVNDMEYQVRSIIYRSMNKDCYLVA